MKPASDYTSAVKPSTRLRWPRSWRGRTSWRTAAERPFLSHLISVCPTSLDIEYYAKIVYRLSMMRKLISAADQIAAIGYQADPDVDASLDKAEDILYSLRHGKSPRDFVHIRQILDKYFEAEPPPEEGELKPSEMPHVPSGFHRSG